VAQGKGLEYSVVLAPGAPETVVTDPQRVRQILKNLLVNAFKFTDHGDVEVEISMPENGWSRESLADASGVVSFAVSDSGIGVAAGDQQRIFEAFAQGDGTTAREHGGTGLGLSISRELAGLLGGELTLTSPEGRSSTFTLYLPLGRSATPTPEPSDPPAIRPFPVEQQGLDDHPFAGVKVLIVDDDYRNVFALTALLERARADVTGVESGPAALSALNESPDFEVVLMDIMMPVMDGYATIRAIRTIDEFRSLPIIAVTGKVVGGERERCLEAGANDYVPKPVDTAELINAIGPWLPVRSQPLA
jgi:CheY-like chemotaxis protein